MKKIIAAAAIAACAAFASVSATQALPLSPANATPGEIILVAGGCGEGWHRGPYGGCRKNFAPGTVHACPRGYHIGPGGRCRGNGK